MAEVLPVSSSAHLALLPWLRRWPDEPGRTTFAAGLHAGSCVGIAWALRADLRVLLASPPALGAIALGTAPAAVTGLLVADAVEERLGRPSQVAALMAGAGVLLGLADRRPQARGLTAGAHVAAALAQVVALAPGVSRGGATLTAMRALGVRRDQAYGHSLRMSLPVTAGAAALTLARADRALVRRLLPSLAIGAPVAAVTSAVVVRHVSAVRLGPIALYRLSFAAVVATEVRRRRRG